MSVIRHESVKATSPDQLRTSCTRERSDQVEGRASGKGTGIAFHAQIPEHRGLQRTIRDDAPLASLPGSGFICIQRMDLGNGPLHTIRPSNVRLEPVSGRAALG